MKSVAPTPDDRKTTRVRYTILAMIFIVSTLSYASRATLSIAVNRRKERGERKLRQIGIQLAEEPHLRPDL
jgi:hypothetical protein